MTSDDTIAFAELLDGTCALLTGGKYSPNDTSTAIFFRALAPYPLDAVRAAFAEHVRRSRFSPTPADLLDLLAANDGRLGAEEAWALALSGRDESDTVVWTDEIAQAWAVARVVYEDDEVGARMAFREAYNRLVQEARAEKRPCEWRVMLGHDPARRDEAIKRAMAEGKTLIGGAIELQLPAPREPLMLGAPDGLDSEAARAGRAALKALSDRLRNRAEAPSEDVQAKAATAAAAADAASAAKTYAAENGIGLS